MRTMRFHVLNETETQKYGKVRPQWKSPPVLFCFADAVVATANVVYGCWPNMFGVRLSAGCLVGCSLLSLWVSLLLVLLNLQMNELLSSSLVVADDAVVSTITAGAPRFGHCCLWLLAKVAVVVVLIVVVCLPASQGPPLCLQKSEKLFESRVRNVNYELFRKCECFPRLMVSNIQRKMNNETHSQHRPQESWLTASTVHRTRTNNQNSMNAMTWMNKFL